MTSKLIDISIVIPYLDGSKLIPDTLSSISDSKLASRLSIEVIIVNGGDNEDDNVALNNIIEKYRHILNITLVEIPDRSMYEAITNGFARATGKIYSYINCGDGYFKDSFKLANEALSQDDTDVLFGTRCVKNKVGKTYKKWFPIIPSFVRLGLYGRVLPFIQQEGTFWKSECWTSIDRLKLSSFKLSGDYFIWISFSKSGYKFKTVKRPLGFFLRHDDQLSENINGYFKELTPYIPFSQLTNLAIRFRFK